MTPAVRQRGVAIITALLIVAIAASVSIAISTRLQLDVRRTANIIAGDQAAQYALTAERFSRNILKADREDNNTDDLTEGWAQEVIIPIEGGTIWGRLTDLQSCFNLNALLDDDPDTPVARPRLERLMDNLDIDKGLIQAIADWLDKDLDTTIPDGAEDTYYMNLERPYRTGNRPLLSISELRLIRGFDDVAVYNTLLPHVCAFGVSAPINVNTASAEVLRSLGDDISDGDISDIITKRTEDPFTSIGDLLAVNDLKQSITSTKDLSVDTEYFMLRTDTTVGRVGVTIYSIIQRNSDGETTVLARSQGVY